VFVVWLYRVKIKVKLSEIFKTCLLTRILSIFAGSGSASRVLVAISFGLLEDLAPSSQLLSTLKIAISCAPSVAEIDVPVPVAFV
jgi:hypothetical protein